MRDLREDLNAARAEHDAAIEQVEAAEELLRTAHKRRLRAAERLAMAHARIDPGLLDERDGIVL